MNLNLNSPDPKAPLALAPVPVTTRYVKIFHRRGDYIDYVKQLVDEHALDAVYDNIGAISAFTIYDTNGMAIYGGEGMYTVVSVYNERDAVIFRMFADDFVEGSPPLQKLDNPRVRFGLWRT